MKGLDSEMERDISPDGIGQNRRIGIIGNDPGVQGVANEDKLQSVKKPAQPGVNTWFPGDERILIPETRHLEGIMRGALGGILRGKAHQDFQPFCVLGELLEVNQGLR